ncbi:MAG: hypothetical protein K9M44_00425 [Candidatus Pacebacteria bacterium]|nr:hypothetical protein [Candidatus Paceibacterota bacterium]
MYDIKVYVACALTHAPESFKLEVEKFKEKLSKICHMLYFKGISDKNSPREVYLHDIRACVEEAGLVVAICDHASIGLGYEIAVQAEKKQGAVLAVASKDALVTKLILDPPLKDFSFRRYENLIEDVYAMVLKKLKQMTLLSSVIEG